MVVAFFICLGILNSPCQAYHELFCNSLNSAGIITPLVFIISSIFLFQMCQMHSRLFRDGLVALEFPQGEETSSPWFGRSISCLSPGALGATLWSLPSWLLGWPLGSPNKSLPVDPPSGRLPSLSVAWGVHHKSCLSLTLPLNWGESSWERKQPEPGDVLRDGHPSPIQFLYPPSVVGIAPDSVHPMLSCYYSVHLRLLTHHPRLYSYQSSALTCQGSLAKIKLHRVAGCSLYTPHASTPSDPTSNPDRLPHP